MLPSINTHMHKSFAVTWSHISTLPPRCLMAGTMYSLWWSCPGPNQTSWTPSDLSKFILVSSDHRMCCQYSSGHFSFHFLWQSLNLQFWALLRVMVFFLEALTSCNALHTVWSVTARPVSTDHPTLSQITSIYPFFSARWHNLQIVVGIIFRGQPLVLLLLIVWFLLCPLITAAPVFWVYLQPAYWALFYSTQPRAKTVNWAVVVCSTTLNTAFTIILNQLY